MFEPQYFLHIANIVLVVAYSVKDILWLRIFALGASLISLPYYYFQTTVLWEPIGWSAVFMTINGYHACRLWLERRPVDLSPDEARLYDLTFFPLARRRFRDLARLGHWVDLKAGDILIRPDCPANHIAVPLNESIDVKVGERVLGRFAAGAIVGAGAFFDPRRIQFEAVASEPCRVLRVPIDAIRRHAERDDLARKLEQVINLAADLSKGPATASSRPFGHD